MNELPRCPVCLIIAHCVHRVKKYKYPGRKAKTQYRCCRLRNHERAGFGAKQYIYLKQDQNYLRCLRDDQMKTTCECYACLVQPQPLPVDLIYRPSHQKFLQTQKLAASGNDYVLRNPNNRSGAYVAYESTTKLKWTEKRPGSIKSNDGLLALKCHHSKPYKLIECKDSSGNEDKNDNNLTKCISTCIGKFKNGKNGQRLTRSMLCSLALKRKLKHKKEMYWKWTYCGFHSAHPQKKRKRE